MGNLYIAFLFSLFLVSGCSKSNDSQKLIEGSFSGVDLARNKMLDAVAADTKVLKETIWKSEKEKMKHAFESSGRLKKNRVELERALNDLIALNIAIFDVCKVIDPLLFGWLGLACN